MTSRDLAGQPSQTLVWDEGRRLEEVRVGNTVEAEFLYAIDDRRVRRIADGVATYYLGDGSEYTIDGANSYFTYFHSVNGRMVAFTKSDTDVTTWMGADIVNSTSNTRDENGVTAQQRYTPFGEVRIDGNLATDHTYTGQVNDETTGLAFYNARYYDPATARFITPDSIVPNPNDGQDYNRYTYVRNNPVKYSDPTGNFVVLIPVGAIAVAAISTAVVGYVSYDEAFGNQTVSRATRSLVTDVGQFIELPEPSSVPASLGTFSPAGSRPSASLGCEVSFIACPPPTAPAAPQITSSPGTLEVPSTGTVNLVDPDLATVSLVTESRSGATRGERHGNDRAADTTNRRIAEVEEQLAELKRTQGPRAEKRKLEQLKVNLQRNLERQIKGTEDGRTGRGQQGR